MIPFGIIGYVPPSGRFNSDAFRRNVASWKTKHRLILFSDGDWPGLERIPNPEIFRNRHHYSVNNAVFLIGLHIALAAGMEFFLYIESDCRVRGHEWDQAIWSDFNQWKGIVAYGSPVIYNQSQNGHNNLKRSTEMAWDYQSATGLAMPQYGAWPGAGKDICLYPNGALGVYHTKTMASFFPNSQNDLKRELAGIMAWDVSIGQGLWRSFGAEVFDRVGFSRVTYSGCGDSLVGQDERGAMLATGKKVAIHQWKGEEDFST
jgi:hypothetical protein